VPIDFTLPNRASQIAIGLLLAGLIAGSWLGLHFYAMFVFELSWSTLPQALVLAAVICWLSVGVFIVSHDAMHGTLAPGHARINGIAGALLLFLYAGFGWTKMRNAHFDHHKLAGNKGDPDFDEEHPDQFWRWYGTFFRRYFGWQSLVWVSSVVTLYWLVFDVSMTQLVMLYGGPAIASSLQLFYFGTYRPHHHKAGSGFSDRHNARSEGFGPLLSLATCFHFGYHLEHHRRPDVPWWALPAARRSGVAA
jgi:beta-carotene ketolase (CrtW type)